MENCCTAWVSAPAFISCFGMEKKLKKLITVRARAAQLERLWQKNCKSRDIFSLLSPRIVVCLISWLLSINIGLFYGAPPKYTTKRAPIIIRKVEISLLKLWRSHAQTIFLPFFLRTRNNNSANEHNVEIKKSQWNANESDEFAFTPHSKLARVRTKKEPRKKKRAASAKHWICSNSNIALLFFGFDSGWVNDRAWKKGV